MDRIPARRNDQLRFLALVVLSGLGALYWTYLYSPRAGQLEQMQERVARLQLQNEQARANVSRLDRLREDLSARRMLLREAEARLASGTEVPILYEAIARIAGGLDLDIVSVTPTGPSPTEDGDYLRHKWLLVLEGDYHRMGRFLSDVAAMDRVIRPAVVSITAPDRPDRGTILASLELEALILRGEDPSRMGMVGTPNEGG